MMMMMRRRCESEKKCEIRTKVNLNIYLAVKKIYHMNA
jgi:hypothetical protein